MDRDVQAELYLLLKPGSHSNVIPFKTFYEFESEDASVLPRGLEYFCHSKKF